MDQNSVLSELTGIFRKVFQKDNLEITAGTNQDDIDQWDSLNHAVLIDAVEKHFDIKFDLMDMLDIRSAGDICDKVVAKKQS